MNQISTRTEIKILQTQLKEKEDKLEDAIQEDEIFEKTKKLYLEMKALHEKIDRCLQSLNAKEDAIFYQHDVSNPSLAGV